MRRNLSVVTATLLAMAMPAKAKPLCREPEAPAGNLGVGPAYSVALQFRCRERCAVACGCWLGPCDRDEEIDHPQGGNDGWPVMERAICMLGIDPRCDTAGFEARCISIAIRTGSR